MEPGTSSGDSQLDLSDLVCTLSRIKVSRMALGHGGKLPRVTFDLGADIKELQTMKGRLRLKYKLFIDTSPAVERAEIEGEVTITSPTISAVTDLQMLGEERVTDIAMQIFRRNYEVLYLTFDSAGLMAPTPWLIQDVYVAKGGTEDEQSDGQNAGEAAPPPEPQPIAAEAPEPGKR